MKLLPSPLLVDLSLAAVAFYCRRTVWLSVVSRGNGRIRRYSVRIDDNALCGALRVPVAVARSEYAEVCLLVAIVVSRDRLVSVCPELCSDDAASALRDVPCSVRRSPHG